MPAPSFIAKYARPLSLIGALALGIPAGRALRSFLDDDPDLRGVGFTLASQPQPPERIEETATNPQGDPGFDAETQASLFGSVEEELRKTLRDRNPADLPLKEKINLIADVQNEKSDLRRYLLTYQRVSLISKDELADAWTAVAESKDSIAMRALARRWAEIDPASGLARLTSGDEVKSYFAHGFLSALGKMDPVNSLRWATQLEPGQKREYFLSEIINSAALSNPDKAFDYVLGMKESAEKSALTGRIAGVLAAQDSANALDLARRMPEGGAKYAALQQVIDAVAKRSTDEAVKLIHEVSPNSVPGAVGSVASILAKGDPAASAKWAASLPEGAGRDAAYSAVVREWARRDVASSAKWLDEIPKGSSRDAAVAAFVGRTSIQDPQAATAWAMTMGGGAQRTQTLQSTYALWATRDAKGALNWLQTAPGLSAAERQTIAASRKTPR